MDAKAVERSLLDHQIELNTSRFQEILMNKVRNERVIPQEKNVAYPALEFESVMTDHCVRP